MKEVLNRYPKVSAIAMEAIERGGCARFAHERARWYGWLKAFFHGITLSQYLHGRDGFHGKHEYVSVQTCKNRLKALFISACFGRNKAEPSI